ncbi:hypothetical protein [Variovorax boronicumulans]|uniref:P-loop NTPase n=1 Tax=Variovorax boronicumulans TaxID=436515 RepID=UPI003393664E
MAEPAGLKKFVGPLAIESAIRFFDGAVPDWSTALSISIPRRKVVNRLVNFFESAGTSGVPIVGLLLAAGCEGKTTAILQAAYEIGKRGKWCILQRRDESQEFLGHELLSVMTGDFSWLILIDEADNCVHQLLSFFQNLPDELQGRVHCLLACRDSDWRASGAENLNWRVGVSLRSERLSGLDIADAQSIVSAW